MKQLFCLLLAACMTVSLCACGKGREKDAGNDTLSSNEEASASAESIPTPKEQETPGKSKPSQPYAGKVDVDLTVLSSTMVYSEVYNMLYFYPEDYYGKTVKMAGQFNVYQWVDESGVVADMPVAYLAYPDDYPELGTEITVIGEFQSYEENGMTWYHLVNARLA